MFEKIKAAMLETFFAAFAGTGRTPELMLNPTEEIDHALASRKPITIHYMTPGFRQSRRRLLNVQDYAPKGAARGEMNYLFSSRRYAAGAIPVGNLLYFSAASGQPGDGMGFPAGFTLSDLETNLDTPNQVPQGKGFIIRQEGISFNMEALNTDVQQVLDSGSLVYTTQGGQFSLRRGPLSFWPGGHGVAGFTALQGQQSAHNGAADPHAVRNLGKYPRVIKPLQQFNYVHVVPRPTKNTDLQPFNLTTTVIARMWCWGEQMDKIPE